QVPSGRCLTSPLPRGNGRSGCGGGGLTWIGCGGGGLPIGTEGVAMVVGAVVGVGGGGLSVGPVGSTCGGPGGLMAGSGAHAGKAAMVMTMGAARRRGRRGMMGRG